MQGRRQLGREQPMMEGSVAALGLCGTAGAAILGGLMGGRGLAGTAQRSLHAVGRALAPQGPSSQADTPCRAWSVGLGWATRNQALAGPCVAWASLYWVCPSHGGRDFKTPPGATRPWGSAPRCPCRLRPRSTRCSGAAGAGVWAAGGGGGGRWPTTTHSSLKARRFMLRVWETSAASAPVLVVVH